MLSILSTTFSSEKRIL